MENGNPEKEFVNTNTEKAYVPYEEIQERKTTKLGFILLILMVIIGVSQGQSFIHALSQNIPSPQNISYCGYYLKNLVDTKVGPNTYGSYSMYGNYGYGDISKCQYSDLEIKYSIENIIEEINPLSEKSKSLQNELQTLNAALYASQNQINNEKQNYGISLQEKIAQEGLTVYDRSKIKSDLTQLEIQYDSLKRQIDSKNSEITENNNAISSVAQRNSTAIGNVFREYSSKNKLVEFERALLLLLLISPVLYLTSKRYFRYKRENSQYTIIWAAVTTIFALLFAQVFFVFIYKVLPIELINKLLEFFAQFGFLVTIGQYILLFAVPAIFGGIVYWIQKKVYNKQAVMRRALKNHKCPSCEMTLRESDRYCPVCSYQIKEKCSNCGLDRIVGLAFCPSCGSKNNQG